MIEVEGERVWHLERYGMAKSISIGLGQQRGLDGRSVALTLVSGADCCKSSSPSSRPRFLEASMSAVAGS